MRRIVLILTLLGLFVLVLLLNKQPVDIQNVDELNGLESNQRVHIVGQVISERKLSASNEILVLDNGLNLFCACTISFKGKNIDSLSVIDDYNGKKEIRVLRIVVKG
ncbi:MAG: hypothetical protein Q7S74_03175 [Nanoarchaeota archaeon]|nr:hypothetical protein [Nanoarchaeota archaeon]